MGSGYGKDREMPRYTNKNKQYKIMMRAPFQPHRTREQTKDIALSQIRNLGLSRHVRVKVTKQLASPFAKAKYQPKGNFVLLHPVNIFNKASDIRGTVNHEITHYKDEGRRHPLAKY